MIIPSFTNGAVVTQTDLQFLIDPPRCQISQSASGTATSLADATATLVTFDTNVFDTDSMHSTASFTSRVVFNTAGLWDVNFYVALPAATYTALNFNLRLNSGGSSSGGGSIRNHPFGAGVQAGRILLSRTFIVGDYIELFVTQTSGAARVVGLGNNVTGVTCRWVTVA